MGALQLPHQLIARRHGRLFFWEQVCLSSMHVRMVYTHRPDWEGIGRWMSVLCFDVVLSLFGDLRLEELLTSRLPPPTPHIHGLRGRSGPLLEKTSWTQVSSRAGVMSESLGFPALHDKSLLFDATKGVQFDGEALFHRERASRRETVTSHEHKCCFSIATKPSPTYRHPAENNHMMPTSRSLYIWAPSIRIVKTAWHRLSCHDFPPDRAKRVNRDG